MSASAGPDGRGIAVGKVDAAIGQPDVVDDAGKVLRWNLLADGLLDQVAKPRGFFDARAGAGAQVQFELAAHPRMGKNPGPAIGTINNQRSYANAHKHQQEYALMAKASLQPSVVALTEPLETFFESNLHPHQRIAALRDG